MDTKRGLISEGRFNEVGTAALYTSRDQKTAIIEAQQGFVRKVRPMTLCSYDVDCVDLVDLTDPKTLNTLSVSHSDLACAWEDMARRGLVPPTWALSKRLMAGGASGVIVQSFAVGTTRNNVNVVFWRWGQDMPHRVAVIDDHDRLPRNRRSWQ